jgi:hypothetical protein
VYSAQRQVGAYRLLIFDGYGSHLTKEFIDYADDHQIICYSLPPHTSHNLQPCDVVISQPFKHHKQAVERATHTGCTDFNKVEFLNAIHSIRLATFKKQTILASWREAGLWPYNPDVVLQKIRPTRPATPPPPPDLGEPQTPTPKTVRSFK